MWRTGLMCCLGWALLMCEANTPENNIEVMGMNLYGGDILLSAQELRLLQLDQPSSPSSSNVIRNPRAVVKLQTRKWPHGEVPYELSSDFNRSGVSAIQTAMERIKFDTDNLIRFRPKVEYDVDYLHIFPGNGCYSQIGRQGGMQNVSLGFGCQVIGVIMHELIHALGRWHEQSRPDRDNYVKIEEENIRDGFGRNFRIVSGEKTSTQNLHYDYDSIMHYDAYAFSSNNEPTITPVDQTIKLDRLGQRVGLSELDKEHMKELYQRTSYWSRWSSWSNCSASCGRGVQKRTRECLGEGQCEGSNDAERQCVGVECLTAPPPVWGPWSRWSGCSQSCGRGLRVRIRSCLREDTNCDGKSTQEEARECSLQECPQVTVWSEWSSWSPCSKRCEPGQRYRSRRCLVKNKDTFSPASNQLSCQGESVNSTQCFVNASCGRSCDGSTCSQGETFPPRNICLDNTCFNDTCLAGMTSLGCHFFPTYMSLQASENGWVSRNSSERAQSLKTCGERARRKQLTYFGLRGNQCYCSSNLTNFIRGGPSSSCLEGCTDCLEVYQITKQEDFDLSVRAYESCGPEYCRQQDVERLICSISSTQTLWQPVKAYATILLTSFIFWAV